MNTALLLTKKASMDNSNKEIKMENSKNMCRERITALEAAEDKLVSFLSSLGELLDNPGNKDTEINKKHITDCYTNLSDASVIVRRELKVLQQSLQVPPFLSKKEQSATTNKLNSLIDSDS